MGKELLAKYSKPIWVQGEIYRETFAMIEENGICRAPFARKPEEVLTVESYDGTITYEAGRDYLVEDDFLVLPEHSRIPHTTWEYFFFQSKEEAIEDQNKREKDLGFGPVATTDGRYLNLSAVERPEYMTRWQVAVTYRTCEPWTEAVPASQASKLPVFQKKLKQGEDIKIVVYGDSISCGYDCSGMYGLLPGQPVWTDILLALLQEKSKGQITMINSSVGGVDSQWAIEHAKERVTAYQPDLVILAFGMNDRCDGIEYEQRIRKLMEVIRAEVPTAEFLLVATTLPNQYAKTPPIWFWAHQEEQEAALQRLCGEEIALADVQQVQLALEKRKRYIDITGNWLNHPNDFLARVQLQVIAVALGII